MRKKVNCEGCDQKTRDINSLSEEVLKAKGRASEGWNKYNKSVGVRDNLIIALVVIILALVGINFLTYQYDKLIDENKFCLNKLNVYFPEYDWESARYVNTEQPFCEGHYTELQDLTGRDGLLERSMTEQKTKQYTLINPSDITYLNSDNMSEGWYFLGELLTGLAAIIIIVLLIKWWNK